MKSAWEDYIQLARLRGLDGAKMSMQVSFEASDGSQVFEGERRGSSRPTIPRMRDWFYTGLYGGRGRIKLLEPQLLMDIVKRE